MTKRSKLLTYVKTVTIFVSLVVLMILYFSTKLPFSSFYGFFRSEAEIKKLADYLNTKRLNRALKYFKTADTVGQRLAPSYRTNNNNHSLVVCIITVDRSRSAAQGFKHRYLVQTAAAVDELLLRDTKFKDKILFICNVDAQPQDHADAVWLQNFIPYVQKNGRSSFEMQFSSATRKPTLLESKKAIRQKEADDYVFCLNASRALNYSYVLMLEDDVMPHRDILGVVDYVLHQRLNVYKAVRDTDRTRPFSYLKLYYPEKWQGYAWEMDRILELVCFGFIGAGVISLMCSVLSKCFGNKVFEFTTFNFLLGFFVFILAASLLGRQAVMELRRFSTQMYKFGPSPRCCTPGMLYNSKILPDMMNYIIKHTEVNKDLAIYDFTKESDIPGFLLEPNLMHHIGMYSALVERYKPPREFVFTDV